MSQITLHGKPVKVGDRVWSIEDGWTTVIDLYEHTALYPIRTVNNKTYSIEGTVGLSRKIPSLFWVEQEFNVSKPLPDLKVNTPIRVWDSPHYKHNRYFSHFTPSGKVSTFASGATSWSSHNNDTITWDSYEIVED